MIAPVLHSGADATWAPSGAAFAGGSLWFGGLRGEALYELPVDESAGTAAGPLVVHLFGDLGRIRQVRVGPGGDLWILTGNRDGRGRPREGDDRLAAGPRPKPGPRGCRSPGRDAATCSPWS